VGLVIAGAVIVLAAGCGRPPEARTTFLRSVDLVDMTDHMSQSFAADEVIGARGPGETAWIVSIDRVVNNTNQIIRDDEKWLYVARLRARLAQSDLARDRSIIWVMPPERWPAAPDEHGGPEAPRLQPTHLLTAEFHALTTTSHLGRADTYVCSYQLLDLHTGTITWEDAWEVKYAASGLTYD
jgi:hypothetical protein